MLQNKEIRLKLEDSTIKKKRGKSFFNEDDKSAFGDLK
jgi:hypothetical protein